MAAPATDNAISPRAIVELRDALERLAAEDGLRAMLLCATPGRHGAFSVGLNHEASKIVLSDTPDRQPPQMLASLRIPSLAALFGAVSGAALELALACDVRVAAKDAVFSLPQLEAGGLPNWGGTQRLARIVGIGRALELILLGEQVPASDAYDMGLVTRLVARDDLEAEASRIVAGWLSGPPIAQAYAKEAVRQGGDLPFDHALRLEWDLAVLLETTKDRAEGIRAFLEKREPRFTGE